MLFHEHSTVAPRQNPQVSEIAQVYWGVCRHARCYTTFKVRFGGWAELRGGGGVLMGLTSPNSPVIVGQEFSPRQLQGQTHLAVGFECRRSSGLFRFIIIRLFWCRAVSGGDGNKHSCAITKRNGRISHCVVQIIIQWVTDGSLPRAFDRCPLPIC